MHCCKNTHMRELEKNVFIDDEDLFQRGINAIQTEREGRNNKMQREANKLVFSLES